LELQANVDVTVAPAPSAGKKFWPTELVLGLLPLLLGFQLLLWVPYFSAALQGVCVFRSFYTCGYMTRTGQARDIHDQDKHLRLADELVPLKNKLNQGMDHPAYEGLLFAPLSLLPFRFSLTIFSVMNVIVLGFSARVLTRLLKPLSSRWGVFVYLLVLAFFPVTYAITGGNDSIILLALLVAALASVRFENEFRAGMLIGLGLFKFQIVIPIAVVYFLWKRWSFVRGFGISALCAMAVSVLMVGVHGMRQYVDMLLHMSVNMRTEADAAQFALSPRTMLNIRGMLAALLQSHVSHWWLQGLTLALSFLAVFIAARLRPSMSLAIVTAALVSYHLNAPDASVLLIPIGAFLSSKSVWAAMAGLLALIVPTVALSPLYGFVGGFAVLAFFVVYLNNVEVYTPEAV
jgi:glycosyl transferase family 87